MTALADLTALKDFQKAIGYTFSDDSLLIQALTHSSHANEQKGEPEQDYERLEFLGDAVLEVTASDYLFHANPGMREGELTKKRASMVCEAALAYCAGTIDLGRYLRLGKGEEAAGGRTRAAILADVMEAVTGAIYLDGGMEKAAQFARTYILDNQKELKLFRDSKTALQEIVQGRKLPPLTYEIVNTTGPEHRRVFTCEARIGKETVGRGEGTSKKSAEQAAADQALIKLRDEQQN